MNFVLLHLSFSSSDPVSSSLFGSEILVRRRAHRGSTGPAEPLLRTTATTNMAAGNFVVIIERSARLLEQPISTNSVPRAFFPRVAIGCRLSLK